MTHRCRVESPEGVTLEVLADGPLVAAVAAASGRPGDDAWVQAVAMVLDREPSWLAGWTPVEASRVLQVLPGEGEMFHASSTRNRHSIETHGLDWRRMGRAFGIAGSRRPEAPAVFLNETCSEAEWLARMGQGSGTAMHPEVDIWGAMVDGLWVATGPNGWWMTFAPIPADRIRRLAGDPAAGGHHCDP